MMNFTPGVKLKIFLFIPVLLIGGVVCMLNKVVVPDKNKYMIVRGSEIFWEDACIVIYPGNKLISLDTKHKGVFYLFEDESLLCRLVISKTDKCNPEIILIPDGNAFLESSSLFDKVFVITSSTTLLKKIIHSITF
ncbi:MAG: hypothetical protein LIP08_11125 [Bacteroides sp.]|nr:hypothetical protein [Bacteroides sp.]